MVSDWGEGLGAVKEMERGEGSRGRVARGGRNGRGGKSREIVLKEEFGRRGVVVDFLTEGMERKKLNQSNWNAK